MFTAKVKAVLSGDTLVLVPCKSVQVPAPERLLTLSYVRGDDSFESKDQLRRLVIGRDIKFSVDNKSASGREFGDVSLPDIKSLAAHLLEIGTVKLKNSDDSDRYYELEEIETNAKKQEKGLWNPNHKSPESIAFTDVPDILKTYPFVVDKVISGDRVIGTLIVDSDHHLAGPFLLGGIRAPRTDDPNVKKTALQAAHFVESKLLTTSANLTATLIGESQNGVPIVMVTHPSGNSIHEKLLEQGLAEIVDWQSPLVGSQTMSTLRKAELTAKAAGRGIFQQVTATKATPVATSTVALTAVNTVNNVVVARIISGDTFVLRLPNGTESTVQLASIRAPKLNDPDEFQKALSAGVREYVRKILVGKTVSVTVDAIKPANNGYEERPLVTIKSGGRDFSEHLVERGMVKVIRHSKSTTNERSANWDKLIELEANKPADAAELKKLAASVSPRVVDASESAVKSKAFLNGFKLKGRIGGYHVDFVPSGNRLKLYNPREGTKLTLILGGLTNERSEAALQFTTQRLLQHNVEFDVYDADKVGGFIGNVYAGSKTPFQSILLAQGLVKLHDLILSNPHAAELTKIQEEAKAAKRGIWKDYVEPVAAPVQQLSNLSLQKPVFLDVEVSDVSFNGVVSFHRAIDAGKFDEFKKKFQEYHNNVPVAAQLVSLGPVKLEKMPKSGDYVSAKFSDNGKYYRARVVSVDRASGKIEVQHLDFGNVDRVTLLSLRVLPSQFSLNTIPAFAHTTTLQNLLLPPQKPRDFLTDAVYVLDELTYEKKLVLSALPGTTTEYESIVYDAEKSLTDAEYTINKDLVSQGWAVVDTKNVRPQVKEYVEEMVQAQKEAKEAHIGCWEFGDVQYEDEE